MLRKRSSHDLLPQGIFLEEEEIDGNVIRIFARGPSFYKLSCPDCGEISSSLHSRYHRLLRDLPAHGCDVVIHVMVGRFRCIGRTCRRKTFVEPLPEVVDHRYARRTSRAEVLLHRIALALGGRPGARLTARLCLRWSKDTLLRVLRRHAPVENKGENFKAVGIDDWAWRRGQSYGTVICDLERRQIVALLAGRDADTVERWLKERPGVCVVARYRGGAYARAAARALPGAIQVADRWHLFANASAAFLEAVRRSMKDIRRALGATPIDPSRLTGAEKRQLACARRRDETNREILDLKEQDVPIREIARRVGCNRATVRRVLDSRRGDVFRPRQSSLGLSILRSRRSEDLDGWLAMAANSLLAPFVNGLRSDIDAVRAALTEPWSSGQVEGQNTKVKLVKRQMYGRAKMDLLSARLVQPA